MPVEHEFPEPLVYEPVSGIHRHTVILLHGRGGNGGAFAPALLGTALPPAAAGESVPDALRSDSGMATPSPDAAVSGKLLNDSPRATLAQALPHARFVFPSAPKQRATVYRRSVIRQWFDDWHLGFAADEVDGRYDLGLQTSGLGSTVAYLHRLIAEESALVGGVRNVILGGISQGCAASLVASLLWEGEEDLGGVVGMCGWLPYISQMREQLGLGGKRGRKNCAALEQEETGFDPFERSDSPGCDAASPVDVDTESASEAALDWLRGELEMPEPGRPTSHALMGSTPALLCHGRGDRKVKVSKGLEAAEFLSAINMGPACLKEFAGVGHDFSAEMLFEIARFIRGLLDRPSD